MKMNANRKFHTILVTLTLFAMLLSACAPAAQAPTYAAQKELPAATEAPAADYNQLPVAPVEGQQPPALPQAPMPTQAAAQEAAAPLAPAAGAPLPVAPNVGKAAPGQPLVNQPPAADNGLQPTSLPFVLPPTTATPLPSMPRPTLVPEYPGIVAPQPPFDNYFQYYGINPFEDAREDHLSTFSLDVDTASYSVARRYVQDGNLPPVGSVRVEEFLNYFDPGYNPPADTAFALYADGSPSPFHNDGMTYLRVGVQGYAVPDDQRKAASLTFVIDTSGSMDMENRLGLVKESLRLLVKRLRPTDTVAIVAYGSTAYIVLNPTSGEEPYKIEAAIDQLYTTGSTNAEAGLRLGYQMAYQMMRPGAINRVILCSDGVANVGETGPDAILNEIRGYVNTGITLTTVGFGMGNFNDVLMEQLADNGDGSYAYVDDLDEARKLFVDNLTSTLQVIAKDAKVQVDFNPEVVQYYRLIGYENRDVADQDFRNDAVDAGEIGAGHSAVALYALYLRPGAQGRLATVNLRWKDPDNLAVHEINGTFNSWDMAPSFESGLPHYQLAVVVAQYAEALRQSPWSVGIYFNQILNQAVRLSGLIPGDKDVAEFVSLVSRASQIDIFR
jgi:Ca-activated chloride channel family protein